MAKQFFKDLPDTSTPINSSRLNGLLDGEEAMGNIVVDSIKGKNLFDKNITTVGYLYDNGNTYANNAWFISNYIPIEPNVAYTSSGFAGGSGNNPSRCYYASDKTFISGVEHNSANPFTDTAPANAYYMRESAKRDDINIFQIEKGSNATNYAPYQNLDNEGTVLFESANGIMEDNINLSDDKNNYRYVEITISANKTFYKTIKIPTMTTYVALPYISVSGTSNTIIVRCARYTFNNNQLVYTQYGSINYNGSTVGTSANTIYVHKVVGYK